MSLHVVALIPIDPTKAAEAAPLIAELARATQSDPGCLSYVAYESAAVPGTFVTVEEWEDQASLDAHMGQPHVAQAIEAATPMLAGEIAIHPLTAV